MSVLDAIWAGVSEETGFPYGHFLTNSAWYDNFGLDITVQWCENRIFHDQDGFEIRVSGGENGYSSGYSTMSFLKCDLADPSTDPKQVILDISRQVVSLIKDYRNNV